MRFLLDSNDVQSEEHPLERILLRSPDVSCQHDTDALFHEHALQCVKNIDNDNDTLKESPHPSNEGLALQARVSGPWPHKKESVLLVELARWQGVQTQTVNGQSAMQQVLR